MSTSGDVEYSGGYSVHRRVTVMHVRDIMIHVSQYMSTSGEGSGSQYKSKAFINLLPHMNHDVLHA